MAPSWTVLMVQVAGGVLMCGGYFQGIESANHSIIYMSHPSLVFLLTISIPL